MPENQSDPGPYWFGRPVRWMLKQLDDQEETVRSRFPIDDAKLYKIRETRSAFRKADVRFFANAFWWLLIFNFIFVLSYTGFAILWAVT